MEARKKAILLEKDFRERLRFARKVKRTYYNDFFMNDICFYLDGVSFYHKYNPHDDANEKLDGNYYADFIRRNFQIMFQKSGKCSKLFVQDTIAR